MFTNRSIHVLAAVFMVSACARLPTLSLGEDLLRDPIHYQVLGKKKLSLRTAGNELRQAVLSNNAPFSMQPLDFHPTYSEHILVVADRQELQVNKESDTLLVLIEGHGYMEGVRDTASVWDNEIVRIPKDAPHAFINAATMPTIIYAVFSPPYNDRAVFGIKTKRGMFYLDESTPIGQPQQ